MLEIIKLMVDVLALRDAQRKGLLDWRIFPMAFVAVAILYAVALSAESIYEKHPQYKVWCPVAGMFDGLFFIGFVIWAYRWQARQAAARAAAATR